MDFPFKKERVFSMDRIKAATFCVDEKIVYPGHGVAKINRIVEKQVAGSRARFYELKFLNKDMTILVPTHNLSSVGIRRLSSTEHITDIFKTLVQPSQRISQESATNWNKRNKDYQCKLRTGDLQEICKIYRDLKNMSAYKELSFGEKALLQQTEMLLAQEISLVQNMDEQKAVEHLRSLFKKHSNTACHVATMI
jgi:CarD family transcriptional regulator